MAWRWLVLATLGVVLSVLLVLGFDGRERRYSGVWLYGFESSTFVEGATAIPKAEPAAKETDWLEYRSGEPHLDETDEDERGCQAVQPFLVTFIGYRTRSLSGAGHMGLWRSRVTVVKAISARRMGPTFCYED